MTAALIGFHGLAPVPPYEIVSIETTRARARRGRQLSKEQSAMKSNGNSKQ